MKRLLTTTLLLGSFLWSFGQTAIGVKLNNPLATVNVITPIQSMEGYNVEYFGKTGVLNTGFFFRMPLQNHFVSQIEMMYKREVIAYRPEGSDLKLEDRNHIRFDYLEVPFLFQFEGKKRFRGFGQVGLAPKILLLASYSEKQTSEKYNMSSYFNKMHLGVHVGGGVMWDFPKVILIVDGRFSTNLTPLTDQTYTPHLYFKDAKSYHFAISVGVGFKVSKDQELQRQDTNLQE